MIILRGAGRTFSAGYDLTPTKGTGADAVVRSFTAGALKNLRAEMDKAAASVKDAQKATLDFYKRVAAKFEKEGQEFISKQQARLGRLLESANINPAKLDELSRKLNILSAFSDKEE